MRVIEQQTTPTIVFLLVLASDHVSPATGVAPTASISKNGGTFNSVTNAVSEIGYGWYKVTLTNTETYLAGVNSWDLVLHASAATCDPTDRLFDMELATVSNIDAEVDALGSPMQAGTAVTLTSAYDPAKTAATQASVTALGSPLQASAYTAAPTVAQIDTQLSSTHGSGTWGGGTGSGSTPVNENTGGTDNLRYVDSSGNGIDNGAIAAYLATDFFAGNITTASVKGNSTTKVDGRWSTPIMLDAGFTYVITFCKQGVYSTSWSQITI